MFVGPEGKKRLGYGGQEFAGVELKDKEFLGKASPRAQKMSENSHQYIASFNNLDNTYIHYIHSTKDRRER